MKTLSTRLDFQLVHPDLLIEQLETEDEQSYVNYENKRIYHACERLISGYEAAFCADDVFYVASQTYLERGSRNYYGYTYACSRHLRAVALALCVTLEEKSLDREFDEWEDSLPREEAEADLSRDSDTNPVTSLEESGA